MALAFAPLPTAAFASGESGIELGSGGLKINDEVYFGDYTKDTTYDVSWIVLRKDRCKRVPFGHPRAAVGKLQAENLQ